MGRRAILKAAIKERQAGKPADEVYKTYQGQVRPNNALAMAIASVADPERKRRYAVLNYVLVALLLLVALLKTLSVVMFSNLSPVLMVGTVLLGLIAPLGFAYLIVRFDGRVYSFLIVLTLLNALKILFEEGNSLEKLADLVLPVTIIAVAFVVQRKIFPNIRLFRVKKSTDGSYVWCDQERRFAEATLRGMPSPVTARQGITVSNRLRFVVIVILIAFVLFVGVVIRFGSGSKVTLAPREGAIAYNKRGNVKKAKGDLDGAVAEYNRAIELDPKYASAYFNRGNANRAEGDLDGAVADYSRTIELDPKDADAYSNRGTVKTAKGDLDGAIADYSRAIELNPKHAIAYNDRGIAKDVRGDLDGAIDDYNRAIELDPKYAHAYYARGTAKDAKGDLDGARADFKRATELDPKLAIAYKSRDAAKDAKVPSASPASRLMTTALGDNLRQVILKANLRFYEMDSDFLNMTRWMQARRNASACKQITREDLRDFDAKSQHVIDSIDQVLGELPVSDQEPWRARRALMSAYSEQARLLEANWNEWHAAGAEPKKGEVKPWQKEAMRLQSEIDAMEKRDNPGTYNNNGNAKKAKGDLGGAIANYNRTIELDPSYALAYNNRAFAYAGKKQYDAAVKGNREGCRVRPEAWGLPPGASLGLAS